MKPIKINDRIVLRKCRSRSQHCICCGKKVGFTTFAICMNNSSDKELVMRKNLWLHIGCVDKFNVIVKKTLKEMGSEIMAGLI